jgi:hypothetical protein
MWPAFSTKNVLWTLNFRQVYEKVEIYFCEKLEFPFVVCFGKEKGRWVRMGADRSQSKVAHK